MFKSVHIRIALAALLLMGITVPVIVWGALKSFQNIHNAPVDWIPGRFEQRRQFIWFLEKFQTPDTVIISWPGCTVDDPRLAKLPDALLTDQPGRNGDSRSKLFTDVWTGHGAVRALMDPPESMGGAQQRRLTREEAIEQLRGSMIGPDGNTSCAVIVLTTEGVSGKRDTLDTILDAAEETVGIPRQDFYLAGSLIDGVAIDEASIRSFTNFALPSAFLAILLCRFCLKSWRLTLAVIAVAGFGEGVVMSLVYYGGATMNAVLIVMAPLILVLAVSSGVHLVNYFHDEANLRGLKGATGRALAKGWLPCLLAAVTTAIGIGSLTVSNIIPIWQFGIFASIGVLVTTVLLFLVVPGAMQWRVATGTASPGDESTEKKTDDTKGFAHIATSALSYTSLLTVGLCLAVMAFCIIGLSKVDTSISIRNLLMPEHRTVRDYRWLEKNIGPLIPIEVVVQFDEDCPLGISQRIELLRRVQQEMNEVDDLQGATSIATFVPQAEAGGLLGVVRRNAQLNALRPEFIKSHWLHEDDEHQSWRISARVNTLDDYGQFLDQLRTHVDPMLEQEAGEKVGAIYTGMTPLVDRAQRALLNDLFYSFLTALATVAVIMMLVNAAHSWTPGLGWYQLPVLIRSMLAGLVAMIPNLFPVVILFGTMGWLGHKIDIGTVMTASVALGIAVDDTLHFMTWFRRELADGQKRRMAVENAFRHCAKAMMQTTLICGLGLIVFGFSEFVPTRQFAWMMITLLLAALVGDLVLLPSLLIGPLGKLFMPPAIVPVPVESRASETAIASQSERVLQK